MNWPEERPEQLKLVAIIAIFSIAAIYLAFMYGIAPLQNRQQQYLERTAQLEDLLWRAERDIEQIPRNRETNREVVEAILALASDGRYVLRSNLGNYELVARDLVITQARRLGLHIDTVREITPPSPDLLRRRDGPPPEPDQWFKPYTVAFTLQCGLLDLARLLEKLESENPLLCITALEVIAQSEQPERHRISFHTTWPIWADEAWPDILTRQLATEDEGR